MLNTGICYVIGAGEFYAYEFEPSPEHGDFVIAADGGYTYALKAGVRCDMVIGDFDSLPGIPEHPNVVVLKKEKDDTDMLSALKEGLCRGFRLFRIYGGTGGRFDHTAANIQSLAFLSQNGARGCLFDKDCVITAVTDGSISFAGSCCGYVSVFSHSDISSGVNLTGLKYPLTNAVLLNTFPVGVSNEFTGSAAQVSVQKGTLVVIYPRECFPVTAD